MSQATRADAAAPDRDLLAALIPRFHITAPVNWLNDPNALTWRDGQYHLFYQYNPDSPYWGPPQWGHVSSADLLRWRRHDVALRPGDGGPDRDGCWSGCLRVIGGQPRIYYTGIIDNGGSRIESVCLAQGSADLERWQRDPASPAHRRPAARAGQQLPPRSLPLARRPRMAHAARVRPPRPGRARMHPRLPLRRRALLDLRRPVRRRAAPGRRHRPRRPLGMPATAQLRRNRRAAHQRPGPRGGATEMHTAYALGTIDNYRFRPQTWGLLDHGDSFYAVTTGQDGDGTPLLFGWAQENMPAATQSLMAKAGALTLPRTLRIDGAGLGIDPAAQLSGLRTTRLSPDGHPTPLGAQFKVEHGNRRRRDPRCRLAAVRRRRDADRRRHGRRADPARRRTRQPGAPDAARRVYPGTGFRHSTRDLRRRVAHRGVLRRPCHHHALVPGPPPHRAAVRRPGPGRRRCR